MMKKVFILFALFAAILFANDSVWLKHDFKAALKQAKKVHKPILLMYSAKT